ncbi:hypothetical protein SS50377_26310 [Spironucleus salmonicida]|uniref:Uncharacterized protein n=1 Tax=Spironucleus salmonicida TaxID=348837 RepID=V6M3G2_9EUKA|nr:hypothetical protein SS50377_26310 [Spironucleus salmonicida]|eukprot:EST47824.1 Hypothetical protein SS50377_12225 [Spironucleus salmonicida]
MIERLPTLNNRLATHPKTKVNALKSSRTQQSQKLFEKVTLASLSLNDNIFIDNLDSELCAIEQELPDLSLSTDCDDGQFFHQICMQAKLKMQIKLTIQDLKQTICKDKKFQDLIALQRQQICQILIIQKAFFDAHGYSAIFHKNEYLSKIDYQQYFKKFITQF